jgi:hypothetical protein
MFVRHILQINIQWEFKLELYFINKLSSITITILQLVLLEKKFPSKLNPYVWVLVKMGYI